jgi:hypothetical protein
VSGAHLNSVVTLADIQHRALSIREGSAGHGRQAVRSRAPARSARAK